MSERHITITAANLHESDQTGIDLETPIGSARDIVIHAPAVRGVYLPLRITYHEGDRSPTARSAAFVVETKAHPTVFEFTLPDWVRRVTIFIPPIPRGAQVLEAPSWVAPGRAEVDGTAMTMNGTEVGRIDMTGVTFGSDELEQSVPRTGADVVAAALRKGFEAGAIRGNVPSNGDRSRLYDPATGEHITLLENVRGHIDVRLPADTAPESAKIAGVDRTVLVKTGSRPRTISLEPVECEAKHASVDRDRKYTQAMLELPELDNALSRRKAGWRDLAIAQGARLRATRETVLEWLDELDAAQARAADLGDAARTLHDRLGERSEAMHAAQRDAAMLERRVAELTNRDKRQAGQITGQADEIAKLRERNERQGETIVKQAQERDDARTLNASNARRIETLDESITARNERIRELEDRIAAGTAENKRLIEGIGEERTSKHQEQTARQTAEQNVREATDALEKMQEQRDEARAERDHAQVAETERLADLEVVRKDLAQARDAIDELASQPIITHAIAEALNGVLRLVEHEGGNADGVSLVEALRLAAQQWEAVRDAQANSRRGWRDADHVLEQIARVLPTVRDADLVERATKLAEWCEERETLRKALTMSDQTITERDATIERMRERHERDGRLNAAMRSELGQLRAAPFTQVGGHYGIDYARAGQARLGAWPTAPECQRVEIPADARSVQIGRAHVGIDIAALLANVAPEFVLSTAGVNRKTFARTVQHLREARQEIRTLRSALRGVDGYVSVALGPWRQTDA